MQAKGNNHINVTDLHFSRSYNKLKLNSYQINSGLEYYVYFTMCRQNM